ncbi:MAG: MerR family transcriptional regulator [Paracoccaceae bacterium]|jgi:DNA-binding transcriptional MerR regulator|nr:MerR family transcriptional regulator [Paracoccaceae bacterium]MDP7184290.1 MerR family transcriptional regulator [Paracoccaceae bacterium]
MSKASDAFRTISEVADWLDTPAHVLRFWESRFSQVKPVKRAGGRRYYRRDDMLLLGGIKRLLHHDGMAIKGVQKLLREKGAAHVAGLSLHQLDGEPMKKVEASLATEDAETPAVASDEPIFQSIGSSAETLPDDQDQMQFPGFGFSSERPKAEKLADVEDPAPEQQPVAADVVSEPEIRSEPIDITHIPLDPDENADFGQSGLLGKLLAMKTGSLAGSPLGLRDAVEKLATIAEARAKPENS